MRRAALTLALLTLVSACEGNDFAPPSIVVAPRLVAVVADPPVAAPGTDIRLTPLVAAPGVDPDVSLEWSAALGTRALALAAGQETVGEDAAETPLSVEDGVATIPGEATQAAIEALLTIVGDATPGTAEDVVRLVYETVGLVVTIRVVMRDADGEIAMEGFKRVLLMPSPAASTNPPPPRFAIDGAWVSARDGADPFGCVPEAELPMVRAGVEVTLEPEGDEAWLETFPALDLDGRLVEGTEAAYYSWFSTAGDFRLDVTRAPNRQTVWTSPQTPGTVPIWLVVRDGHLGTSACRAEVAVVAE